MLWTIAFPAGTNVSARRLLDKWSLLALRGLLVVGLVFVFVHVQILLKGYEGGGTNEWLRLLTETATGRSWLSIVALSFLGFAVLRLNDVFKMVWAMLLAASESFNGHIHALPANTLAIVLDFVHLLCAALWAGGLLLLLLFWYADRKEAGRFAEKFTKAAWLSILLLTASGIGMTFLILPSWRYLLYTDWGILLLAKAAIVFLAIAAGALLHRRARRREMPSGKLLKLDGLLLSLILIIVSVFTYASPVPETEPLYYHKMGDTQHYTLAITPNGPGPNRVLLKVWLTEQLGAPVEVQLRLLSDEHPERAAIDVQLHSVKSEAGELFRGFIESDYIAEKVDLPSRGAWTAELVITDATGTETKQIIEFNND
jgi:copper transport protein